MIPSRSFLIRIYFKTGKRIRFIQYSRRHFANPSQYYIKAMEEEWRKDPKGVHVSWDRYFRQTSESSQPMTDYSAPAVSFQSAPIASGDLEGIASIEDHLDMARIIRAYQSNGHLLADIDPIGMKQTYNFLKDIPNSPFEKLHRPLMESRYLLPENTYIGGNDKILTLSEIIKRLKKVYCKSIGIEYGNLVDYERTMFIRHYFEPPGNPPPLTKEEKVQLFTSLSHAHQFETFLHKKWPGEKRFGLDGCEVLIPAVNQLIEKATGMGAVSFVFGMAHRGRLNVLVNSLKKPAYQLLSHFHPLEQDAQYGTGDVKYHLGTSNEIVTELTKKKIRVSMVSNPSHLESVNPVVEGKVAGEQRFLENNDKRKVWPILIHGDAAMCGQGVVYETFHLSELHCYQTGGTVHFIINNQIGFTTDPMSSRSSEYCSAVAKVIDAPVFHVNGDDPEAVIQVVNCAAKYREKFQCDVVIDIVAYRRFGHNEIDEPMFTQPVMYKKIQAMTPVNQKYSAHLINNKVLTQSEVDKITKDYENELEGAFKQAAEQDKLITKEWIDSPWKGFFTPDKDPLEIPNTGVKKDILDTIGKAVTTPPAGINVHKAIQRILKGRNNNLNQGIIDWGVGESLAFASLLQEGIYVRLTGQDVERGTFSHRHHVLHDQTEDKTKNILEGIFPNQAEYFVCNSSLCEFGILGFELGMSMVNPNALFLWEAQFGDFANSAQIIIDQYLCCGEIKWIRQSGITLLLPHGLDGMGPEHSSARVERFLQLCHDDDSEVPTDMSQQLKTANWFIVNVTTPANFFHVLRRQVKLNYRKPLVIFTPKFLLRHPDCVSPIDDFLEGTKFKPYITDPLVKPSKDVKKLLLCSGKVYYDLIRARKENNLDKSIAVGRVEQLSPVPYKDIIEDAIKNYPDARVFWVQEEHKNQGPWTYMWPRLTKALGSEKGPINYIGRSCAGNEDCGVEYVGRPPAASPATGYKFIHEKTQKLFINAAMTL